MTRRMAVHFWPAFTVISRATSLTKRSNSGRAGGGVGAEDRGVEAVGLHGEAGGVLDDRRARLELAAGPGGAGEGDGVLPGHVVEQVAGRAGDQLDRALGQDARLDDAADDEFGQVGGLAGRLHDRGDAGDEGRRDLLKHAPDREVEGVDVDRDAGQRGEDVLGGEGRVLRQHLDVAVGEDAGVRQLTAGLGGVGEQRAGAALDVDPAVGCRVAPVARLSA